MSRPKSTRELFWAPIVATNVAAHINPPMYRMRRIVIQPARCRKIGSRGPPHVPRPIFAESTDVKADLDVHLNIDRFSILHAGPEAPLLQRCDGVLIEPESL